MPERGVDLLGIRKLLITKNFYLGWRADREQTVDIEVLDGPRHKHRVIVPPQLLKAKALQIDDGLGKACARLTLRGQSKRTGDGA